MWRGGPPWELGIRGGGGFRSVPTFGGMFAETVMIVGFPSLGGSIGEDDVGKDRAEEIAGIDEILDVTGVDARLVDMIGFNADSILLFRKEVGFVGEPKLPEIGISLSNLFRYVCVFFHSKL